MSGRVTPSILSLKQGYFVLREEERDMINALVEAGSEDEFAAYIAALAAERALVCKVVLGL